MPKPLTLMNFASDATLTGGPQAGLAPRLRPSAGQLTQGFYQERRVPARMLSWILGTLDDNALVAAHAAMQTWDSVTIPLVGSDTYVSVVGMRRVRSFGVMTEAQRKAIVIGYDLSDANKLRVCMSNDGNRVQGSPSKYAAFTAVGYGYACAAGEMIVVSNGSFAQYAYTTDSTNNWTSGNPFSGPPTIRAAHYVPGAGAAAGYYLFNNNGSGTAAVGKATNIAFSAGFATHNLPLTAGQSLATDKVEVADNGSILVLACTDTGGTVRIIRSTDGGTTWNTTLTPGGSNANITYNEYWDQFVVWSDTGNISVSADGASWTTVGASTHTAANGFSIGRGTMASAGAAIAKVTTDGSNAGVWYSFDLGATWHAVYIDDGTNPGPIVIRGFNGRLYAIGPGRALYRSGLLTVPSATTEI